MKLQESFVMKSDHQNRTSLENITLFLNISLLSLLHRFLSILLHDDADRPLTMKVSSFAQDLLYAVNKGRHLTLKRILLPLTIKSPTGNVDLIKIINRLNMVFPTAKLRFRNYLCNTGPKEALAHAIVTKSKCRSINVAPK